MVISSCVLILHISDFHFHRPWFHWLAGQALNYDVACLSGDWLLRAGPYPMSIRNQTRWVRSWLAEYPGHLVGCTGNHDWWNTHPPLIDTDDHGRWLCKARRDGILLDESGSFGGLGFHGQPWGEPLNLYPSMPLVVVTHAPPHGYPVAHSLGRDGGDVEVMEAAGRLPAGSLLLSGHIHDPRRWCCRVVDSWCFNPGVNRDGDEPNHIIIDTDKQTARAVLWGKDMPLRSISP